MADLKISGLITNPGIDGTEEVPTSRGGSNFKNTYANLSAWMLASPTLTGVPLSPNAAVDTNTTQVATTAYVVGQGYAKLASPTFTGVPLSPTAAPGTNTTQVATTAFVTAAVAAGASGWGLTGNAGTTVGTNFIGTSDAVAFAIGTSGTERIRVSATAANIGIGTTDVTTAIVNIKAANDTMTTKYFNAVSLDGDTVFYVTKAGQMWLGNNGPTGVSQGNLAIGYEAGLNMTTTGARHITALGCHAARNATSADSLTVVGANAMAGVTIGVENTAMGRDVATIITTGGYNSIFGSNAGAALNTASAQNSFFGAFANGGTAGVMTGNSGFGYAALNRILGDYNTSIGFHSGMPWTYPTNQSYSNTITVGPGALTASNQMVIGGKFNGNRTTINNIYFNGRFDQVAGMAPITIQNVSVVTSAFSTTGHASSTYGASVTDGSAAASVLNIAGAQGTGTGAGGAIVFKIAPAGATGAVSNALVTTLTITSEGDIRYGMKVIDTTAGDSATINALNGRFRKDTGGNTFTLTNSFITANSIITLTMASSSGITGYDAPQVAAGAGSAVITFSTAGVPAPPTANLDINFFIAN